MYSSNVLLVYGAPPDTATSSDQHLKTPLVALNGTSSTPCPFSHLQTLIFFLSFFLFVFSQSFSLSVFVCFWRLAKTSDRLRTPPRLYHAGKKPHFKAHPLSDGLFAEKEEVVHLFDTYMHRVSTLFYPVIFLVYWEQLSFATLKAIIRSQ